MVAGRQASRRESRQRSTNRIHVCNLYAVTLRVLCNWAFRPANVPDNDAHACVASPRASCSCICTPRRSSRLLDPLNPADYDL